MMPILKATDPLFNATADVRLDFPGQEFSITDKSIILLIASLQASFHLFFQFYQIYPNVHSGFG